jgi:pimeloyl-ACP methyl ester carboxylesterase
MYWRSLGEGGTPLVVVHGGFGSTEMMASLTARLAAGRQVISVDLQGHGHTADVDRPFGYETFGDDLAGAHPPAGPWPRRPAGLLPGRRVLPARGRAAP